MEKRIGQQGDAPSSKNHVIEERDHFDPVIMQSSTRCLVFDFTFPV